MRKLGFIIGIIVLLMALMPLSIPMSGGLAVQAADPGWYWKPGNFTDYAMSGMPDFDQKQDMWRSPPVGGAWSYCGPVAVANSLWWFDSANEPNPQPPSNISDHYGLVTAYGQWDDHNASNVQPLVNDLAWLMDTDGIRTQTPHNGTDVMDMQAGIAQYFINKGYAAAYTETTVQWPDFYWIEEEVERCQDVVLLLGFYNRTEMPPGSGKYYYERIGGHYVTCAGVNSMGLQLGISDPYYDNAEAGGPGVVPMPHPVHPGNGTVHNNATLVSHDIYNVTQLIPGPGGLPCWALLNYANGTPIVNFVGQNGGGWNIPGPVVTIIDYAVDVSPTAAATYTLTMAVNGTGTTTPAVGSYSYAAGMVVNITATPGAGWQFVNWTTANIAEIANATAASTTVNVDENKTVTANFALSPGWYWKPGNWTDYAPSGMPDFDQKQDMWQNPPVGGSWSYCGPVAVANSLWWFDSKNEPFPQPPSNISDHYGLVTAYGQWDDHNASNVMPLVNNLSWLMDTDGQRTQIAHNGTDVMDMQQGIRDYLNATGYAAAYNETTVLRPDFHLFIEPEVERCEDVVLLLGFWQHEYGSDYWWRVGGHYVTVAGVNSNTSQLGISDPYFDNAEAGGPGVVPVNHTYPHGAGVHNDTQYVSHDIYNVIPLIPGPGGSPWPGWALINYANGTPIVNFLGQNSGPLLTPPGPYQQQGFVVETVIDYAVAVSPTAGNATLGGHVSYLSRGAAPDARWIEPFLVRAFEHGNLSHEIWNGTATTNNTGVFTMSGLTPGTYDVGIKNWTCLSELVTNVTLSAGVTTVVNFGTTREGDSNGNDAVTGMDFSLLSGVFNTAPPGNPNCDFNRDNAVTGMDFSLLNGNFNKVGPLQGK